MKTSRLLALCLGIAIALPGAALAQAYKWRDEKGGMVFSDTPPPPNIPRANILIKDTGLVKHLTHIRYISCIPRANILIKGSRLDKHLTHIRHISRIPRANILIKGNG